MKFLILDTHNPHWNLAVEEYLFKNEESDVFMLWQNSPTVVIGKNQNASIELDSRYAEENGITVARRITGGGAVYHDLGNVNYSFISSGVKELDFARFTAPIIEAIASLGVKLSLSGRNDVITEDGKKISGGAECKIQDKVLHHGTLLFNSDLSVLGKVLVPDKEKLEAKAVRSVRSRVANIKEYIGFDMSTREFIEKISEFIIKRYSPEIIPAPDNEQIRAIFERNGSRDYIYPKREFLSSYTFIRKKRYPFGIVECHIGMKNDKLEKLKIFGDFFGNGKIPELEEKILRGELHSTSQIPVGEYISGMSDAELYSLIYQNIS